MPKEGAEKGIIAALEVKGAEHGIDIVDVEVVGATKNPCVRVRIDHADEKAPTITLDEVTAETGWISDAIDELDPFPAAFTEVYGVDPEEAMRITEEYRAVYQNLGRDGWPLFDGMRELLGDLRAAGRKVAIASFKRQFLLDRGIDVNGVRDLFDLPLGKERDNGQTKAMIIGDVLGRLGFSPDQAVMVGDRRFDAEAAHEAGLPCVGVTVGHTCEPQELVDAGCCALCDTVDDLRRVLLG